MTRDELQRCHQAFTMAMERFDRGDGDPEADALRLSAAMREYNNALREVRTEYHFTVHDSAQHLPWLGEHRSQVQPILL